MIQRRQTQKGAAQWGVYTRYSVLLAATWAPQVGTYLVVMLIECSSLFSLFSIPPVHGSRKGRGNARTLLNQSCVSWTLASLFQPGLWLDWARPFLREMCAPSTSLFPIAFFFSFLFLSSF